MNADSLKYLIQLFIQFGCAWRKFSKRSEKKTVVYQIVKVIKQQCKFGEEQMWSRTFCSRNPTEKNQ